MDLRFTLAFLASLVVASPALAKDDQPYACRQNTLYTPDGTLVVANVKSCIRDYEELITKKNAALAKAHKALDLVWKIAFNPSEILNVVDLSVIRAGTTPIVPRVQRIYNDLHEQLSLGRDPDDDPFAALRSRYADAATLGKFYDSVKQSVLGKITKVAIVGMAGDTLQESAPLFEKPLAVIGAVAGDWYSYGCWKPLDELHETSQRACKKLTTFPNHFKEAYGVDVTPNTAYVLSWLYRRHMEGGPKIVAEWQRIGKDLSSSFSAK